MENYYKKLRDYVISHPSNFGDGESVLTLLYEAYDQVNPMDDGIIKADFNELYQLMNGMPLREMDKIIYPVCRLCRDHERSGFIHGIRIGIMLVEEIHNGKGPS